MAENRDYVMARLAAARGAVSAAEEALDACILFFLCPGEDKKAEERNEALEAVADAAGDISRSVELAQAAMEEMGKEELTEEEPDPEEGLDSDGVQPSADE